MIARAREGHTRAAEQIVQASSRARIASVADGGADYRSPSVTREQLWSVVEGASADTATRTAAAEALAISIAAPERSRLRAAASRSADPRLRVALDTLASDEEFLDRAPGAVLSFVALVSLSLSSGLVRSSNASLEAMRRSSRSPP